MSNFAKDIIEAVGDDVITAVVIEVFEGYSWNEEVNKKYLPGNELAGKVIKYSDALKVLDYEYDSGYGGQECHNIYMYSETKVYYIHEYDGSTSIEYVPRNPI